MTTREIFEKVKCSKCEKTLFCNSSHGELNYLFCYNKYLKSLNEQALKVLKTINEAINDDCISDAQAIIKTLISQIEGKELEGKE